MDMAGPALVLTCAVLLAPVAACAQTSPTLAPPPSVAAVTGRSLLVPGLGQLAMGQKRGWGYLAVEAALWAWWTNRRAAGADARNGYRDLAWSEARGGVTPRADGAWAYYETLSKWTRSGAFDTDPNRSGVQPETDVSTYNGSIWKLARDVYLPAGQTPHEGDSAYQDALAYYERRAYASSFLWDWSGKDQALHSYKDLIRKSDDGFRQATTALGAVLANHLLSGADAYVSSHLPGDAGLRVLAPPLAGRPTGWSLVLHMGVPR